ncbi:MAG: CARDB domain-containing protein [Bacteroidota bacterium]
MATFIRSHTKRLKLKNITHMRIKILIISLLCLTLSASTTLSQTTVFSEDFETPPGNTTSSGNPGWFINNRLSVSGVNSDSSSVSPGSSSFLTTNSMNLSGLFFVTLSFKSICKAEFFDGGTIEYSIDGGTTWIQFIDNNPNLGTNNCTYLGTGLFQTQSSKFQEASYAAWQPGTPAVPVASWWQTESFDISVVGNQADVRLRFVLADGNNNGSGGRNGWFIDDIQVVGAACELVNPTLSQTAPTYPSTVFNLGPYTINADADDQSGLNSVTLYYSINGGSVTALPMTFTVGTNYTANIPAVQAGDNVCYYIEAIDASGCQNTTYFPGPNASNTNCFTAQAGVTFPYCDNFDIAGIPWVPQATSGTTWQLGNPSFGATTGAHSTPNAWDINLNSSYTNNANTSLVSPEFSFTVGAGAKLEFWQNRNVENTWDGVRLEWATNLNGPWTVVGTAGAGCNGCVNWYNNAAIISSGQPGWTGNSGGWIKSEIELGPQFNNQPQVWFRFVFTSDGSVTLDGFSMDDFCISLPQANDVGVVSYTLPGASSPAGGCVNVEVTVQNFGANTQTNFPVSYSVNGGPIVTGNYSGTLTPGATATVTLPCFNVPVGAFNLCTFTGLSTDGDNTNDTLCIQSVGIPVIPVSFSQQYFDNFNGPNQGWAASNNGNTNTNWQLGTPAFGGTNSAYSGTQCWDVNLTSAYGNNANCVLTSPLFDFTNAVNAEMSFYINHRTETAWDGTRLEYSVNGGPWILLGGPNLTAPCWTNWYNSTPNIFSSGQPAWMGNSTPGWIKAEAKCLGFLNNAGTVQFRFVFTSDGSVTVDGFSIDDFRIDVPIPLTASPIAISSNAINNNFIFPGQPIQFNANVSNPGTTPLTSVNVTLTVNGTPVVTDIVNYSPSLASQQSLLHNFTLPWLAAPGVYNVCAITSLPNNGVDLNPIDDTTCITLSVFDTVSVTQANPYCTDFETGPQWIAVNPVTFNSTPNSWQLGTPSQTVINGAYSGANAWMTGLGNNYPNTDTSALFTPLFSVDNTKCYKLSFYHKFQTDPYVDGGIVEYSTDNAQTWLHLGFWSPNISSWYNTPFVTALGGNPGYPGWSGNQLNWTLAERNLNFWTNGNVMFRFRFGSDQFINFEGWAIDNFCFEEITGSPCLTSIENPEENGFSLSQNYPNPISQSSEIEFNIPENGQVKLQIDDLLGRTLMVPFEGNLNGGNHRVSISGAQLPNGLYTYTLTWEGQKLTKRLVVSR